MVKLGAVAKLFICLSRATIWKPHSKILATPLQGVYSRKLKLLIAFYFQVMHVALRLFYTFIMLMYHCIGH